MKFKKLTELDKEKIAQVITDIFSPKEILEITYHNDEVECTIITSGWEGEDGEELEFKDVVTLSIPTTLSDGVDADFIILEKDILKWKQFCIANGCHYLLKDNPYLDK